MADLEKAMKGLWAGMLEYGLVIETDDGKDQWWIIRNSWNQYSATFDGVPPKDIIPLESLAENIDWEKTTLPFYDTVSEFNDTDSPNTSLECMVGKLVMKSGDIYWLGTTKITNVMRLNKDILDSEPEETTEDLISKWQL